MYKFQVLYPVRFRDLLSENTRLSGSRVLRCVPRGEAGNLRSSEDIRKGLQMTSTLGILVRWHRNWMDYLNTMYDARL